MNEIAKQKCRCWFYSVLLFLGLSTLAGSLYDRILWELSYDYVFPDDYARDLGIRWSTTLGSFVASMICYGRKPLPSYRWVAGLVVSSIALTVCLSVVAAMAAWGVVKMDPWLPVGLPEAPLSRLAFCNYLVLGAKLGAWFSAGCCLWLVWSHRSSLDAKA